MRRRSYMAGSGWLCHVWGLIKRVALSSSLQTRICRAFLCEHSCGIWRLLSIQRLEGRAGSSVPSESTPYQKQILELEYVVMYTAVQACAMPDGRRRAPTCSTYGGPVQVVFVEVADGVVNVRSPAAAKVLVQHTRSLVRPADFGRQHEVRSDRAPRLADRGTGK